MTLDSITPLIEQSILNLFEQNFGKLPDRVRASANEKCLIIRLEGFMGDTVKTMISENSYGALSSTRELIVGYMLSQFSDILHNEFDLSAAHFCYDWNDEDLSCIISVILQENEHYALDDPYTKKSEVHAEISAADAPQAASESLRSFWVDQDFLVVIRRGLLTELEQTLLQDGHQDALRQTKRKVEKKRFAQHTRVPAIVDRKLCGIYLDWVFEADSSMLVYAFEPLILASAPNDSIGDPLP